MENTKSDLPAHMVVQRIVKDQRNLRGTGHEGIDDKPKHPLSDPVGVPLGSPQEVVCGCKVLRFMKPRGSVAKILFD